MWNCTEFLCAFNSVFPNDNILEIIAHYQNEDTDICIMLVTEVQTLFRFYQFIVVACVYRVDDIIKLIPNIQSR